jgi:hypothetical protein
VTDDHELPDTRLFWRWVGKATRPVAGWVLVAVGALMIIGGYFGVANEVLVAKQLPYLISGGLLGVAVVIVGVLFIGTEEIRRDSGRLDRLERMVDELHGVLLVRTATAVPPSAEAPTTQGRERGIQAVASEARLVALPDGERYHTESCPAVAGKPEAAAITARTIARRDLRPCPLCEPALAAG